MSGGAGGRSYPSRPVPSALLTAQAATPAAGRRLSGRLVRVASVYRAVLLRSPRCCGFVPLLLSCWCVLPVRSVFLSVPNAERVGIYKGLGTPLPICADLPLLLAAAAPALGVDGAFLLEVGPSN